MFCGTCNTESVYEGTEESIIVVARAGLVPALPALGPLPQSAQADRRDGATRGTRANRWRRREAVSCA